MMCFVNLLLYASTINIASAPVVKKNLSYNKVETKENHICSRVEKYVEEKVVAYNETYQVQTKEWCFRFPFICTKTKILEREVNKTTHVPMVKTVFDCCKGYEDAPSGCRAVCPDGCVHGKCVLPNNCSCEEGWQGLNCTVECKDGWYGKGCDLPCSCKNGATCEKKNGACHCEPGFVGSNCEYTCTEGLYGEVSDGECKCKNGGTCDLCIGTCTCPPGYTGEHCEEQCKIGTYGKKCKEVCECDDLTTALCSHIDGKCTCRPGWRGDKCSKMCDSNTWGDQCSHSCQCAPNAQCDHITGDCFCKPGWQGQNCEEKCPIGFFEKDCNRKCPDCLHNPGTCHHVTGWCDCPAGSTGQYCDLECPENKYGENCKNDCLCMNSSRCDPFSGTCFCLQGWMGENCSMPCSEGFYGPNCSIACNCTDKYKCDSSNGTCRCEEISQDPICTNRMLHVIEANSLPSETEAPLDISTILLAACILFGTFLFLLFVLCAAKKLMRSRLVTHKEENSTTNVTQESNSPSISSFRFMNPSYDSLETLQLPNKRNLPKLPSVYSFPCEKEREDIENGDEEFGIPDCETASPLEMPSIEICFRNDVTKNGRNSKVEAVPEIRYSNSAQMFYFPQDKNDPRESDTKPGIGCTEENHDEKQKEAVKNDE